MIGHKMMLYLDKTKKIHSLADKRLTISPEVGSILTAINGIWLGTTVDYVQQYYGSCDPNDPDEMNDGEYEVRCKFEYDEMDIIKGSQSIQGTIDKGIAFMVNKATLLEVFNVTKGERLL